jgi:hypothetical protein
MFVTQAGGDFQKTYVLSEHYPLPYIKAETVKYRSLVVSRLKDGWL